MVIGLIACCSKKLDTKSLAKDIYISTLFRYSMNYLYKRCDKVFILSARYGLLELNDVIEPYNVTLNNMNRIERVNWSKKVLEKLNSKTDLLNDNFIILAGKKYREDIIKYIKSYSVPMINLGIGKQLKFLKEDENNE